MFNTQEINGNNNEQVIIGKQKAKSITNQFRPSEEQMAELVVALKGSIDEELSTLKSDVMSRIDQVLKLAVNKSIVEFYKDKCASEETITELSFTVADLKSNSKKITDRISAILASNDNLKTEFKKLQDEVKSSITALCKLCEDILYSVRLAYKQCKDNNIEINAVKELISNYIKAAELSNERILAAIQTLTDNQEEKILPTHLAINKIAEMFAVIKEISEKQKAGEAVGDVISGSVDEVNNRCKQIQCDIDEIRACTDNGNKKADEILRLARNVDEGVKEANNKLDEVQQQLQEANDKLNKLSTEYQAVANCQAKMDSAISSDEREKLECEFEKLRTQLNETLHELEIATSTGEMSPILPCRYCGTKAERKIIGGECVCTVCGHRYHLDPNISEFTDKQIETDIQRVQYHSAMDKENERVVAWKKLHTAELEEVSPGVHSGLYRMKLDKYTVSSNGVLIIPNKTWDLKDEDKTNITEIAFCQPNTYDKEGLEQLSRVRTLFLSEGIKVTEYGGEKPFSQIKGLEKIMKWDGDGYVVDDELSPKTERIVS